MTEPMQTVCGEPFPICPDCGCGLMHMADTGPGYERCHCGTEVVFSGACPNPATGWLAVHELGSTHSVWSLMCRGHGIWMTHLKARGELPAKRTMLWSMQ